MPSCENCGRDTKNRNFCRRCLKDMRRHEDNRQYGDDYDLNRDRDFNGTYDVLYRNEDYD